MAPTSAIPQTTPTTQPNIDFSQFGNYSDSAKQAIQNGASLQDVQNAYNKTQQQAQPQQPQQKQPSWWEKLLPTAGGVLGGIAGTFVSPIFGSAAGAGIGGALGQQLENSLTGQKQSTLTSGLENAAGGLLGGVGGKVVETGLGALSGAAEKGASSLFAAQGPGLGKDISQLATKTLGINDLPTAAKFGEVLSGSTDPIKNPDRGLFSKFVADQAEQNSTKHDLTALQPAQIGTNQSALKSQAYAASRNIGNTDNPLITEQLISKNGLKPGDANAIRGQIQGVLGRPENAGSVTHSDLLGMQKQLSGMAADASNAANRSGASIDQAKANVLNQLNQNLKDRLGFDNMPVDVKTAQALANDVLTNASPIHKNAAQVIAKQITDGANSKEGLTVAQVRNMESNMVQLQQSAKNAIAANDKNFGTSTADLTKASLPLTGAVAGGSPSGILGAIIGKATASPTADKFASQGLSSIGRTLSKGTKDAQTAGFFKGLGGVNNKDAGLLNKVATLGTRASALGAANLPNIAGASQPTGQITQGAGMQGTQGAQGAGGAGAPGQDALSQLYNTLYQQEQLGFGGTQTGSLISALNQLAPQVNKQQIAANAIQQLMPAYQNAGGAQGLGGGLLSTLSGLIPGSAANVYGNQQQATAGALGNALGISPAQAGGLTPQLMSNQQTANPQITALQNLLSLYGGQAAPVAQ